MSLRKGLLWAMLVFLALSALGGIGEVFADGDADGLWRIIAMTMATAGASGLAAGSLEGAPIDRQRWRWIGVAAAGVAWLICLCTVFSINSEPAGVGLALLNAFGIAVVVAHANLSRLCPLKSSQRFLRFGAVGAVVLTFVLVDIGATIGASSSPNLVAVTDFIIHAGAAAMIAATAASLALLVLFFINRGTKTPLSIPTSIAGIAVVCPYCQKQQTLSLGESRCAGCGMKFRIEVEEPRCPKCNYLLYMLSGDRCPECGTAMGASISPA